MQTLLLTIVLAPLAAAIIAGIFGKYVGRVGAHSVTIFGVSISFALSLYVLIEMAFFGMPTFNGVIYNWAIPGGVAMNVGFLVDHLSALMMTVVTFVSLCVHVYTIGYMHDDPGYKRFFGYISLFTFAMLMLVMANNFMQLFFGWEAVGLVSYLLIGFWYTRPSAIYANLKAFLVNRVGDFGFVLGIAAVLMATGSLNYADVFAAAPSLAHQSFHIAGGWSWSVPTVICVLLFIGAMGKSAQVPLHVWLPDSMEGPTPISALIHAATMVTAGIYMVARMSPLFELSATALNLVLVIGAITCFFMGILGVVQNDIKRVIAYSTLSQLGYMTVALGASAYAAGIFHLMTHAFFKALLFLGAGSVIIAMHHEQDMRRMGGLRKYMPITYWTFLIGSLALVAFPGFSGYFSKDMIIDAVGHSHLAAADIAWWATFLSVFVTALYTFRMFFMTFHGKERMDEHTRKHLHETPWVVTVPLIALAIPSIFAGALTIKPLLFGGFFASSIYIGPGHNVLGGIGQEFAGAGTFFVEALTSPPFYLMLFGIFVAWYCYMFRPETPAKVVAKIRWLYAILARKFYFDDFNQIIVAGGGRSLGKFLWRFGDQAVIDGGMVNGTAYSINWFAGVARRIQTGYLYHYAFAMVIGLAILLGWFLIW
ncbi:MAG TPA: NADH-quinone oxidoreductase subunit L [Gammaproteobacteria bacterium]|nr:NADH-quinone oxidoreductase subunit L [Gammaproteobacteria bacterium]